MAGDGFFVAMTTAAAFCVWDRRQSVCFCMSFTSTVSGSGSLMTKSATKSERRWCATDKHWNWGSKADSAWKHPIFPNNLDGFYWIHMGYENVRLIMKQNFGRVTWDTFQTHTMRAWLIDKGGKVESWVGGSAWKWRNGEFFWLRLFSSRSWLPCWHFSWRGWWVRTPPGPHISGWALSVCGSVFSL